MFLFLVKFSMCSQRLGESLTFWQVLPHGFTWLGLIADFPFWLTIESLVGLLCGLQSPVTETEVWRVESDVQLLRDLF